MPAQVEEVLMCLGAPKDQPQSYFIQAPGSPEKLMMRPKMLPLSVGFMLTKEVVTLFLAIDTGVVYVGESPC